VGLSAPKKERSLQKDEIILLWKQLDARNHESNKMKSKKPLPPKEKSIKSRPFALVLNGTSSVGKSSIATILSKKLRACCLNIDIFINILPQELIGETAKASPGFRFYQRSKEKITTVQPGSIGNLIVQQMHDTAKSLLASGLNVIVDHVTLTSLWVDELEKFSETGARVVKVLITCDMQELTKREMARGDRRPGLAKGLKYVEGEIKDYDLIVNTTSKSPKKAAEIIMHYLSK